MSHLTSTAQLPNVSCARDDAGRASPAGKGEKKKKCAWFERLRVTVSPERKPAQSRECRRGPVATALERTEGSEAETLCVPRPTARRPFYGKGNARFAAARRVHTSRLCRHARNCSHSASGSFPRTQRRTGR
jgi:hypothetical protein